MHKKIICLFKCICFLAILFVFMNYLSDIFQPKYYFSNSDYSSSTTYRQFYKMENDTIDVVFLGSSVAVNAFSPMELYKKYNIRSYNLGSEMQSLFLNYFWLKEAFRLHSPDVVVIDSRFCLAQHPTPVNTLEGFVRKCLDEMKLSSVKLEAIRDLCSLDDTQSWFSYIFKPVRFHGRWTSLSDIDFSKEDDLSLHFMGYSPGRDQPVDFVPFVPSDSEARSDLLYAVSMEYLEKAAQLCKKNNAKMILVNMPGSYIDNGIHNEYLEFAKCNDIDYYNFAEAETYAQIGASYPDSSIFGHASFNGAVKIADYLGNLLLTKYNVNAVYDKQYEDNLPVYEELTAQERIKNIDYLGEYLANLPQECSIIISCKDDASSYLSQDIKDLLKDIGLSTTWDETMFQQGYIAVISPDNIYEAAKGYLEYNPPTDKHKFPLWVKSGGIEQGNISSIIINGQEHSLNMRGMNIVIYSHLYKRVIDKVNFDTYCTDIAVRN